MDKIKIMLCTMSALALFVTTSRAQFTGGVADGWASKESPLMPLINFLYAHITPDDTAICIGTSVTLNGNPIMGDPPYTHLWTGDVSQLSSTTIQNPVFTATTAGTFLLYYTVTDAVFATYTDSVYITVNSAPVANAGTDATICQGTGTMLNASGGTAYQWGPSLGLSATNIANPLANPPVTTTYTVTVTNAAGCTDTDDVTVTVDPVPSANAGADVPICLGSSANLNASGGGTYLWSPATGLSAVNIANPVATPATTTTYTVVVTNGFGCTAADNVTVTVNSVPVANAGADVPVCTGSGITLNASGGLFYAWSPATGLSNPNISNPVASPSSTTTYTVTVSNGVNCTATDDVLVTVNPVPVANAGSDETICSGSSVTLNASGGGTYSWSPSTGLNIDTIANPFASPAVTTNYVVTVSNDYGCTATDNVTVTVNPVPVADAGADTSVCLGSAVSLNASGGTAYLWGPSTGLSDVNIEDPVASPVATTIYTVTVTNGFSCSSTDDVTVTVDPLPSAGAGPDEAICQGQSTMLTATGGDYYLWSPATGLSGTDNDTVTADPVLTTTYIVTVTNSYLCTATDQVTVTVFSLPVAEAGNDISLCSGDSAQLSASGGNGYLWNTSGSLSDSTIANPWATPSATTTYIVTVTDNNSCSASDSVTVTIFSLPVAEAGNDISICSGDSAQLSASGGNGYLWNTSVSLSDSTISNPWATPSATTTYNVTVTDNNSCSASDSVTVTVLVRPVIDSVNVVNVLCYGSSGGQITVWSSTGSEYSIDNGSSFQAGNEFSGLPSGNYQLIAQSAEGCMSDTTDLLLTQPAILELDSSVTNSQCGTGGVAEVLVNGGTPPYSYSWSHSVTEQTSVASGLSDGTFTVTVTDANGCSDSLDIIVSGEPGTGTAQLVNSSDISCFGFNDGSATVSMSGGTPPYTYLWSNNPGYDQQSASDLPPGNYSVTISDDHGCSSVIGFTLAEPGLLEVSLSVGNISCYGLNNGSVAASASGGTPSYSFLWSGNITDSLISGLSEGQYYLTVTDAHSCIVTDSISIVSPQELAVDTSYVNPSCAGYSNGEITADVSGGTPPYQYLWTGGYTDSLVTDVPAGVYYCTITDYHSCTETIMLTLTEPPAINITSVINIDNITYAGSIDVTVTGGQSPFIYSWSNGETTEDLSGLTTGTYIITVTDAGSCQAYGTFEINAPLIIPNAITPNDDGINDDFEILNIISYEKVTVQIYNRWGDLLFRFYGTGSEYSQPENRWDGTINSKEAPMGSYLYIVSIEGIEETYTGALTVVR